jgi:hypothetical protein
MKRLITKAELEEVGRLFTTPSGKNVLKVLERLFYEPLSFVPDSDRETSFNEGHRDTIMFIKEAVASVVQGGGCDDSRETVTEHLMG